MASHGLTKEQESDVYRTSYQLLKDTIALNRGLKGNDLSKETARQFRPIYKLNKSSEKSESNYPGLAFELTPEGDIFYPGYGEHGITAEQLNENTRIYNPDLYSVGDHQASRLAAKTLAEGATFVATTYAREGSDNRDVQVFVFDPVTRKGRTQIFNTSVEGNNHSFTEIRHIMAEMFPHQQETKPVENVSLISDKPLEDFAAKVVVESVSRSVSDTVSTFSHVAIQVRQDVREAFHDIKTYFINRGYNSSIPEIISFWSRQRRQKQKEHNVIVNPPVLPKKREKVVFTQQKSKKENSIPFPTKRLLKQWKEVEQTKATVVVLAQTGVAIGIALYGLRQLIEMPAITKFERKGKTKKKEKIKLSRSIKKERRILKRKNKERIKKKKKEAQTKLWKKELKREVNKTKENKQIRVKERVLWKTLRRLVKRIEQIRPKKEKKIRREEKKQFVRRFAFALMVWTVTKKNFHLSIDRSVEKGNERLQKKEPTQWILLAIIRFLAMIRESRGAGSRFAGQLHPKKQAHAKILPKRAVIFTFAS